MVGRLDECFLVSYAIDRDRAAALLPAGLEPLTAVGAAFANVVACRVDRMRPAGLPRALGVTYWHVAIRLQARARLADGQLREGLHFLRSDADRRTLAWLGARLTDFRFHAARIRFAPDGAGGGELRLDRTSPGGQADGRMVFAAGDGALVAGSCFSSAEERDRVLAYAPLGLATDPAGRVLRVAEVVRDETAWRESPVDVKVMEWPVLAALLGPHRLERATRVEPLDYRWRLGVTERLAR